MAEKDIEKGYKKTEPEPSDSFRSDDEFLSDHEEGRIPEDQADPEERTDHADDEDWLDEERKLLVLYEFQWCNGNWLDRS